MTHTVQYCAVQYYVTVCIGKGAKIKNPTVFYCFFLQQKLFSTLNIRTLYGTGTMVRISSFYPL